MVMPQIQIEQRFGQIGLSYTPPHFDIRTRQADLTIEAPAAELSIHTTPGRLDIDQTEAFADEDLRTPLDFSKHQAALARQTAAQGVAEAAQWGQRLLHIERGDAFPAWVMRYRDHMRQFAPALVPRPFSVHIHYEPGRVDIQAQVQPVRVHAQPHPAEIEFVPGQVHTYLEQRPEIRIIPPPVEHLVEMQA
ncbi:DUF6470 family protein [Alicyclobacillus macrosporangiidus]|uniref:Uncharacterized protein n=1 Tax=Alicyclobacillus macrosporangiidus TaxID=392015 RepID=A0A1I7L6W2_9BACL|nr:DUF6470 family protein [Alicyclobacillus macrosporangiidus]SFV05224.1 hypothetical protein SAMN05421543_12613 [Alicyclobacillus macrosporangiidus]